jgi:hypothetical protein
VDFLSEAQYLGQMTPGANFYKPNVSLILQFLSMITIERGDNATSLERADKEAVQGARRELAA